MTKFLGVDVRQVDEYSAQRMPVPCRDRCDESVALAGNAVKDFLTEKTGEHGELYLSWKDCSH